MERESKVSLTGYDSAKYSAEDEKLAASSKQYRHSLLIRRRFEQAGSWGAAVLGVVLFCADGFNLRLLGLGFMLYGVTQVSIASLAAQQALMYNEINLLVVRVDRIISALQRAEIYERHPAS
jgi:hypothetical protein